MAQERRFLGREFANGAQFRVYLRDDALEVDELTYSEGERSRVYFDDVLLLTYHRMYGAGFIAAMVIIGGLFLICALMFLLQGEGESRVGGTIFFAVLAAPFLVAFALRILFQVDVITVYGRRTFARLKFPWRKKYARRVFQELAEKIGARQAEMDREQAARSPKALAEPSLEAAGAAGGLAPPMPSALESPPPSSPPPGVDPPVPRPSEPPLGGGPSAN